MNRPLMPLAVMVALMLPIVMAAQKKEVPAEKSLSIYTDRKLVELKLVGAGIGVIHPDGTTWVGGFGLANMEQGIRASGDTIGFRQAFRC